MMVLLLPFLFGWLLLFSCLIAMARTSNTKLNKSCKSRHPCIVPDLRKTAFSFSLFSMLLDVGLSYMAFIMLRYVPSVLILLRVFILNGCSVLSDAFSASIEMSL